VAHVVDDVWEYGVQTIEIVKERVENRRVCELSEAANNEPDEGDINVSRRFYVILEQLHKVERVELCLLLVIEIMVVDRFIPIRKPQLVG